MLTDDHLPGLHWLAVPVINEERLMVGAGPSGARGVTWGRGHHRPTPSISHAASSLCNVHSLCVLLSLRPGLHWAASPAQLPGRPVTAAQSARRCPAAQPPLTSRPAGGNPPADPRYLVSPNPPQAPLLTPSYLLAYQYSLPKPLCSRRDSCGKL